MGVINFSMKLNLEREQDRLVYEALAPLSRHNKADYVKMAILAYTNRQNIQEAIQEALAGTALPVPKAPAICSPSKSALKETELKTPPPALAVETSQSDVDLSFALDFMNDLNNGS